MAARREFVDTNVLVYAYSEDDDWRHGPALSLVAPLSKARNAAVSIQVLMEYYNTITRKGLLTPAAALARVTMLSRWPVHSPVPEDVIVAAALAAEVRISLWDAMIVRSAERMGCSVLWTEDLNHGQVIAGVEIRNPFAD